MQVVMLDQQGSKARLLSRLHQPHLHFREHPLLVFVGWRKRTVGFFMSPF
jgi:hypothetical protein